MPPAPNPEESIFAAALEKPDARARAAFLDAACGPDVALRARVEALLRSHEQACPFLVPPNAGTADYRPVAEGPGSHIGPYRLMELIGEGGMGLVFVAEQQEPVRRKVALKVIKPGMDSREVLARFEAERQALALMDHPHIAKVLDAGSTETGRPYFVMELVKGLPITEYCDAHQLPPRERLRLFADVCQAVQHAHIKGVIHRDLKPSNVLVAPHDGVPVVKVIDFGVAKALGQRLTDRTVYTRFAQMIGTPPYMSPEQAEVNALDVDTRSDVYALGVLLYELLTGTTPFDRQRLLEAAFDEIRRIIREEEPPTPSNRLTALGETLTSVSAKRGTEPRKLWTLLRGDLDWIVMKALEKDRSRRYDSASAFAADVRRFLADEPVEARPPSAAYRLRKFVRRHRAALLTSAALLTLLLAAVASSTLGLLATRRQRDLAERARAQAQAAEEAARASAAEARREKDNATHAQLETQAVLDFFLTRVVAAARPEGVEGGLGPDVRLRTVLEAAGRDLQSAFADRPTVEAVIRHTLGVNLAYLGDYPTAIRHLERALELRKLGFGPDHPATLQSMNDLADTYSAAGRGEQALALFRDLVPRASRCLGPDALLTLMALRNQAAAYHGLRQFEHAVPLLEEALRRAQAAFGRDHYLTVLILDNLGDMYRLVGRTAQGIPLLEEAYRRGQALPAAHRHRLPFTMHNLAVAYHAAGREKEALALLEQAVQQARAILGPGHPAVVQFTDHLAQFYDAAGRREAAARLRQDLDARRPPSPRASK